MAGEGRGRGRLKEGCLLDKARTYISQSARGINFSLFTYLDGGSEV